MHDDSQGWIKIHRKILDHWINQKPEYFAAWIKLLLTVQYSDEVNQCFIGGSLIECGRGQSIKSIDTWVEVFGTRHWTYKKVRLFFDLLEREKMIFRTNVGKKTTKLTVCNYETYQTQGQKEGNKRANGGQTVGNRQESKEGKEGKKNKAMPIPSLPEFVDFCAENGIATESAEGMFYRWESQAWESKGQPIKNWKAKVKQFIKQGYIQSAQPQQNIFDGLKVCN